MTPPPAPALLGGTRGEAAVPAGSAPRPVGDEGHDDRSPYARAQDLLSDLVDAAAAAHRIEAIHTSVQLQVLRLAMDHAVAAAEVFTSPRLTPERRRDLAIRSVIAEFATAMRLPERTMQRMASDAWALTSHLPRTLAAMQVGSFGTAHARVVIEAIEGVDDAAVIDRLDHELAELASRTTAAALRRRARRLRGELLAERAADRHRAAAADRRVEVEPARDGMAWLHLFLPAADAALVFERVDRAARSLRTGESSASAEPRTLEQLRADVARDLLLMRASSDASDTGATTIGHPAVDLAPTVAVTVPVMTLLGGDEPAVLEGHGPIDADSARRLAAHAPSFLRILTHPITGAVLDVDRRSYRPPADLAKWVRMRDETCRFPGCNRRAEACELDHTLDWAHSGTPAHDNLAALCSPHHHLKHETAWSVRQIGDGELEWRSPIGRRYRTEPAVRPARSTAPIARASSPPVVAMGSGRPDGGTEHGPPPF